MGVHSVLWTLALGVAFINFKVEGVDPLPQDLFGSTGCQGLHSHSKVSLTMLLHCSVGLLYLLSLNVFL